MRRFLNADTQSSLRDFDNSWLAGKSDKWSPGTAGCVCEEPTERLRATKYMEHRIGCVLGNCCNENRAALIPVCKKPTPEISTFA